MHKPLIALAILACVPTTAQAATPPADGSPDFAPKQVRGAVSAAINSVGTTSWLRWRYNKPGILVGTIVGSCYRVSFHHYSCYTQSYVADLANEMGFWIYDRFYNCGSRSTVTRHRWLHTAFVDRPTILVHRPPKGTGRKPWRDGGVVCANHETVGGSAYMRKRLGLA